MYSKRTGLVLGFHGCDQSVRDKIIKTPNGHLRPSSNDYDWLGNGIYFWENNCKRALDFAKFLKKNTPHNSKQKIQTPSVIGAVIDLGYCMDLLDSEYLNLLKEGYNLLEKTSEQSGFEMPKNVPLVKNGDLIKRFLDCAVIETIHQFNSDTKKPHFDSVRGVFFEGKDLYINAGFKSENHIQIVIRNPNCIKGYFIPRELDKNYPKP
jgi:hypothetical protein